MCKMCLQKAKIQFMEARCVSLTLFTCLSQFLYRMHCYHICVTTTVYNEIVYIFPVNNYKKCAGGDS